MYTGEDTDELTFEPGDVICVIPWEDPEEQVRCWGEGLGVQSCTRSHVRVSTRTNHRIAPQPHLCDNVLQSCDRQQIYIMILHVRHGSSCWFTSLGRRMAEWYQRVNRRTWCLPRQLHQTFVTSLAASPAVVSFYLPATSLVSRICVLYMTNIATSALDTASRLPWTARHFSQQ